jgi:hypothetical protein
MRSEEESQLQGSSQQGRRTPLEQGIQQGPEQAQQKSPNRGGFSVPHRQGMDENTVGEQLSESVTHGLWPLAGPCRGHFFVDHHVHQVVKPYRWRPS